MSLQHGAVSVVIPTRNRAAILGRAVSSVVTQTFLPNEVIVVDDASSDDTQVTMDKIIEAEKHVHIRYVRLEVSGGANYARNLGVQLASSELVAFQDSDDVWDPRKLEFQVPLFDGQSEYLLAYSALRKAGPSGAAVVTVLSGTEPDFHLRLMQRNFISTQTVIGQRELFLRFPFDNKLSRFQDWDAWLRMIGHVNFIGLPEPLVEASDTLGSISRSVELIEPSVAKILANHRDAYRNVPAARMNLERMAAGGARRSGRYVLAMGWAIKYFRSLTQSAVQRSGLSLRRV